MKNLWFILLLYLPIVGYSQASHFPICDSCEIVEHEKYSLCYNEKYEQASWVFYELTKDEVAGDLERTDDFREDPLVSTGSASLEDYVGSGFDRGHIAPAADMEFSATAMSESFYMSNMSPQHPSFNRGRWKSLEGEVRKWAYSREAIWVTSGPVLKGDLQVIGENQVAIPEYYYKVLLDTIHHTCVAFLLPNQKCEGDVLDYIITVDSLEVFSGIDFNSFLSDSLENEIESRSNIEDWPLSNIEIIEIGNSEEGDQLDLRCKGITGSGNRCKRTTKKESGYCWQHDDQ